MSAAARNAIVERIEAIADWREERAQQDMLGLGPEAARRSNRSAAGLRELAGFFRGLPEDDALVAHLERVAFSGVVFDPGALLLTELGRFRFHDPEASIEQFAAFMVTLAEQDREEMGQFGGPQVAGDNPWGANWVVDLRDPDEEDAW